MPWRSVVHPRILLLTSHERVTPNALPAVVRVYPLRVVVRVLAIAMSPQEYQ